MKKYLLLIICISLLSLSSFAQETAESDTVKSSATEVQEKPQSSVSMSGVSFNFIFQWKKKTSLDYPFRAYSTGIGLVLSYLDGMKDVNYSGYGFVLNGAGFTFVLNKHFVFSTGIGDAIDGYILKGNVSLKRDSDGVTRFVRDDTKNYKSSDFSVFYITIPFLLEYQVKMKKNNTFFISGGVHAMLDLFSTSNAKIRTENGIKKEKYKHLHINTFNARFVLQTGININNGLTFGILGYYQPFSTFKSGKGPNINPYGIGIVIDWFNYKD